MFDSGLILIKTLKVGPDVKGTSQRSQHTNFKNAGKGYSRSNSRVVESTRLAGVVPSSCSTYKRHSPCWRLPYLLFEDALFALVFIELSRDCYV